MTQAWLWSRPLAPLLAALAAGIAAPSLGLAFSPNWLALALAALLLLMAGCCWRGLPLTWAGVLLFFCIGLGLYQTALHPNLPPQHVRFLPQNTPVSLIGIVKSRPIPVGADYRLELAASSWFAAGAWHPACGAIWLSGVQAASTLQPGDQVAVRLILWPVEDLHNPGASRVKLALARRQIYATGRLWQHLQPVKLASGSSLSRLAAWREEARRSCRRLLDSQPQPARAVFLALLLGDQTEISPTLRLALSRTGASHLMAISGLHLAMLAGASFSLIFWLMRRSAWLLLRVPALKWSAVLAAGPVLAYVWLAGGSPATQRAAIMILAYLLLVLLDRHRDVYSVLILAALVILVASPLMLYSLSFQLSFLSVWGLACLSPVFFQPWRDWVAHREYMPVWLQKTLLRVGQGASVSLAATLATLPVIVASFHQAPTYGIIINLLAVPLIGGLALPLIFLAVLFAWLPGPLSSGLLYLSRQFIELSLFLIHQAAALPGVAIRLPAPTVWQTAAYFLIILSLVKASRQLWRWTGISLGLLVMMAPLAWSGIQSPKDSPLLITALDTSREMAVVATLPHGASMVISAGAPRYFAPSNRSNTALISFLHARRLRQVDYLTALTVTPENAHTLLALAQEFEVQEFWYGGDRPALQSFWELRNMLGDGGREVKNLSLAPIIRQIGGVLVRTRQLPGSAGNRTSGPVLLELEYQGQRLLIMPPGPAAWRQQCLAAGLPPSQVVILPAANLKGDFLAACLGQVKPRFVVVAGAAAELPSEVSQHPDIVWHCTGQGAVTLTISSGGLVVSQLHP